MFTLISMCRLLAKNLFLFAFIVLTGCAARTRSEDHLASINIIDRNGFSETITTEERLKQYENVDFLTTMPYQKVLRVYGRDESGNIASYITSYHPNGQPKQYLEVVNGRAFGKYQEWFSNGKLKIDANVIGGAADIHPGVENTWVFDNLSRAWDEEGNLKAEILYSKGDLEGISYYYHPNGVIWKKIPNCKHLIDGTVEIFLETGQLLQSIQYVNGLKEGLAYRYWQENKIASAESYIQGKLESGVYFDCSGNKISEVNCGEGYRAIFAKDYVAELQEIHGGLQEGIVKMFGKSGRLLRTYKVKNNFKHGEEVFYFDDGIQPKLSLNWYENKIQGSVKSWYSHGTAESKREFNNNAKNGIATAWYRDGNLMLIEEYDQNKLLKGEYYKKGERQPVSRIVDGKGTATLYDGEGNFLQNIPYNKGRPIPTEKG